MRIENLPENKEIFTAKVDEGYVGCVRLDEYVCFTVEVFDSALRAANRARNLQRSLKTQNPKEYKKNEELPKVTSKKPKKKVAYTQKLYTLAETEAMPLLRFQEVWVITKGELYVRDCLDKERKELIRYTKEKDQAKYFIDHEKAKMTMRVLRGVIGPGFDLTRFFIENDKRKG